MDRPTRRTFCATVGAVAVAGCTSLAESSDESSEITGADSPPVDDRPLPLPDETEALADSIVSGGVPQDGIPSIDDPNYFDVDEASNFLDDGDPVFGVSKNGDVRAYPQRILVYHEIVNDVIGGENLAVTYCPLTGTAQGFECGETEFGVSGRLLNSNLVMYDRATESYWPQMLATAIRGPHEGSVLREFSVTWTTWERWRGTYPETSVLSDATGYARSYDSDPYGSYNPPGGFYADDSLLFEPYRSVDESTFHLKDVVLGARSADGSIAVGKDALAASGVLEGDVGDVPYVAVYEPELDTGYIYRNPDGVAVSDENGQFAVDGESYDPDDLPLERLLRYDAFWFAWAGYYPDTVVLD